MSINEQETIQKERKRIIDIILEIRERELLEWIRYPRKTKAKLEITKEIIERISKK